MRTLLVAAALITKRGRILVAQREAGDDWGLRWEFPGGTLEEDEGPQACIKRELREELGIEVAIKGIRRAVFRRYEGFNILLLAYQCRITEGTPLPIRCRAIRWVSKEELKDLSMPPADEEIREGILQGERWDLDAG
jgi:8-oxo-dGTP diphosphatase